MVGSSGLCTSPEKPEPRCKERENIKKKRDSKVLRISPTDLCRSQCFKQVVLRSGSFTLNSKVGSQDFTSDKDGKLG